MDVVNFINIGGDFYLGRSPSGIVKAKVLEEERFKYASWEEASSQETQFYWEQIRK